MTNPKDVLEWLRWQDETVKQDGGTMGRKTRNCPFCGSENLLIGGDYIECQLCGVIVSSERIDNDNQNSIVDIWNRRSAIEAEKVIAAQDGRADDD